MQVAEVDVRFGVTLGVTDERSSTPQLATIASVTSPRTWLQTGYKLATGLALVVLPSHETWLEEQAPRTNERSSQADTTESRHDATDGHLRAVKINDSQKLRTRSVTFYFSAYFLPMLPASAWWCWAGSSKTSCSASSSSTSMLSR